MIASNKPFNVQNIFAQLSFTQAALGLMLLVGITYLFYIISADLARSLEDDLRTAFDQQNLTVVDIASSRVGFHIDNDVAENVKLLGQFPAMQRLELHNGTRDMEKVNTFAAPRVDGFALFKANGDFFTAFPDSMRHLYQDNQANTDFFKTTKETASLYFSGWIHAGNHLKMRVAAPVFNRIVDVNFPPPDNKLSGIIMAQIDFDRTIASELGRLKSSGLMHWIVDETTGEVLYHSVLPRTVSVHAIDSKQSKLAKKLLTTFASTILEPGIHRTTIDGQSFSIASARSKVGPHNIIVNLAYDDSAVTGLVQEKTNRIYMLGIAFLISVLIGALIILRQMAKRQSLTSEKEHLSRELALKEEKKKLGEQVFQLQKMESLGELAAGTAHELNNALSAPMGLLSILKLKPDMPTEKRLRLIDKTVSGMEQARTIIEGLLRFSRSERNDKSLGNINDDIKFVTNLYQKECLHAGIELRANLQEGIPDSIASHQQILLNLVTNAKYVSRQGDHIDISSEIQYKKGVKGILIKVADSGSGMDKETQQRIFEPFFSTKPVGEGTGLGLSICYGIVQDHGGIMAVQSEVGEGSTLTIWLPMIAADSEEETVCLPF